MDYAISEATRVGDLNQLPEPLRVVFLIQGAQGMIDNGGLQYFFEAEFIGLPPYSAFVEAYQSIGAIEEARAIAKAVRLFPFADPHRFLTRRLEFLEQFLDGGAHRPDSPFEPFTEKLCGNQKIWRLLDEFIEQHAQSFPST
ncbi:MAG TPA: DUF4375 domain-containing protein [Tepidisphaeraceae bacterium]|nr:DUF4375 domain-containing protein [Tepidisphaeraceae bacterium]